MARKPRVRLDRPARRAAILAAAAEAFADRGFADTSMDDVAAAAGITRLIVYRHFGSKEDLYTAVLQHVRRRLAEELALAAGPRGENVAVRALLGVARTDAAGLTLLLRHAPREPQFESYAREFREQMIAHSEELMAQAHAPTRVRTRWAAETLVSFVIDALLHWIEDGDRERDDEFVARVDASLPALVGAWASVGARQSAGQSRAK
jgi:AcrR family transcriptional regulator